MTENEQHGLWLTGTTALMKTWDLVITRLSDSLGEVTVHQRLVDKHGLINSLQEEIGKRPDVY